jgi:hypothetical protein
MATGYSGVEIGYGEYIGYHHDSKMLFGSASSNIGTAVAKYNQSGGVFRFRPLASITIPTRVRMNIAAAVSTGNICDGVMIGG